jgi:hypothetical protein
MLSPGDYNMKIKIFNTKKEEHIVKFTVMKGILPKQQIITTNWVHYDCISYFSNTKPFSK